MFSAAPGTRDPQSFDHLVARYDRYAELVAAELRTWLRFHLPTRTGRGLDAGCGTGLHTELLAERCNEVLAVDLSAPMLDYASTHCAPGNVRYEVRDLHEVTTGQDGPFDVVLCAYTLHHVPDFVTALEHLHSLVRPGGTVLLVDVVDDRRRVPRAWLRREAVRGFRDDLFHRRRPVGEAVELLRLSLDSDWLDHQSTDRVWPPELWDEHCRAVFPGAVITPLYRARALSWQAPAPRGRYL
jgi:2-polyprenyl-3-methyl-5-hydroxy-6-metoxy-1,4-benzoquinol methylase